MPLRAPLSSNAEQSERIGSLDQFLLVLYASKDTRLTACDLSVLIEVVDRFQKDDDSGIASGQAHLMRETGRSDGAVQTSRRRLVEFGYLAIEAPGRGSTGTRYRPNFDWSRAVRAVIKAEKDARKAAKLAKRKSGSGAVPSPTSQGGEGGRSSAPLRDLVWQPTAPLPDTVGQSPAPHTYGVPSEEGTYGRLADGVGSGLPATPPAANDNLVKGGWRRVRITDATVHPEDGNAILVVTFSDDTSTEIYVRADDHRTQAEGQEQLNRLMVAALGRKITSESELIGADLMLFGRHYDLKFAPLDQKPDSDQPLVCTARSSNHM